MAVGRHGMAATSHPASTLTAIEIMKAGGNAMDAAVAACAVQSVVEAGSTGIGGDCFALISPKGAGKPLAYNGSGRTPSAAHLDWYVKQGIATIDRQSPHAVTIPGAVEAWARLIADHGRMSLREILAPAVAMARDGYPLTERVAYDIASQLPLLSADEASRKTFLVDGRPPQPGDIQKQPGLADTLQQLRGMDSAELRR